MTIAKKGSFYNIGLIGWRSHSVFLLIAFLLATDTGHAGQLQSQVAAAELQSRGDLIGAETVLRDELREAQTAGPHSVEFARALAVLGAFYQDIGRFSQAELSFTRSLRILREITGEQDLELLPLITHLGWLYVEAGRAGPATRLHLQSWVERLASFDPESKHLPTLLEIVGGLNALQGRFTSAQDIFRKDFDLLASRGADFSVEMASARNNFGFIELRARRYNGALNDFSKSLELWTQLSGPDDLQVAISRVGLAEAYMGMGEYDKSSELFRRALPVFEQKCGPNSLRTEDVLANYALVLRHQKLGDEARKLEERARLIRKASAADLSFKQVIDVWELAKSDPTLTTR